MLSGSAWACVIFAIEIDLPKTKIFGFSTEHIPFFRGSFSAAEKLPRSEGVSEIFVNFLFCFLLPTVFESSD